MSRLSALLKSIPKGRITTYGIIANKLHTSPRHAGYLLKHNQRPVVVPCYRVVKSDGKVGGYTCNGRMNVKKKIKLLEAEGVHIKNGRIADFGQKFFNS